MNEELVKRLIGNASEIDFLKNRILWESTGTIFHMEDMIRLIEIVVEECAKVADNNYNSGFAPVGADIKDHFGVK